MKQCAECGKKFSEEDSSGAFCYRCKLDGLSFNFVGGGSYTRGMFNKQTVKEGQDRMIAEARSKGNDIELVPQRAELI
jgi:hypothetical protein